MYLSFNAIAILAVVVCSGMNVLQGQTVNVDITPEHALNHVVPQKALGGGVDRISVDAIDKTLTKEVLDQIKPSGWGPITYRQNTELSIEAWHWNPQGSWSDPRGKGYFTGDATPSAPIRYSFGYELPRRGVTRNGGAEGGYSVLTDGDANSFWKSSPYLDKKFTGESNTLHPQWVILDLKKKETINSLRIAWGEPFARKYQLQFWTGKDPIGMPTHGIWQALPNGVVTQGRGGEETIRFSEEAVPIQFLRVMMTESSNTCDADGPSDIRNCVGYAIRELYAGTSTANGEFHDLVRHTPDQDQTTTYNSSVDPWHEPTNLLYNLQAQPGLDLFFTSGVTHGLPAMIPISLLYGQPEDAVAQMRYLAARHYPVSYVEMGEEVDGQYMSPEDYAALYLQFAKALHAYDPTLKLGGPAFEGVNEDITTWPDEQGRISWLGRFLDYLKQHGKIDELAFFSFEHYPFEPCKFSWAALYDEPNLISHIMQVWRDDGLPPNVPVFITESNLSSIATEAYFDNFGGLWLADYIGSFLNAGGDAAYFFHYLPLQSGHGCNGSFGNYGMFRVDANYKIIQPLAQFYSSQIINTEWLQPGAQSNTIFPSSSLVDDGAGHKMVTSYAAQRPDKQWSILLVNRDQNVAHTFKVAFHQTVTGKSFGFRGQVDRIAFGKDQYQWHASGTLSMPHPNASANEKEGYEGHADPGGSILRTNITATPETTFTIPAASILVLRGAVAAAD